MFFFSGFPVYQVANHLRHLNTTNTFPHIWNYLSFVIHCLICNSGGFWDADSVKAPRNNCNVKCTIQINWMHFDLIDFFFPSVPHSAIPIFLLFLKAALRWGRVRVMSWEGVELSVPPPGPHPRTFSVRIRCWSQRKLSHPSILSSAVLKWKRS